MLDRRSGQGSPWESAVLDPRILHFTRCFEIRSATIGYLAVHFRAVAYLDARASNPLDFRVQFKTTREPRQVNNDIFSVAPLCSDGSPIGDVRRYAVGNHSVFLAHTQEWGDLGPFVAIEDLIETIDGLINGTGLTLETPQDCDSLEQDPNILTVNPLDLILDPKTFQYKIGYAKGGSTGSLLGVKSWDPDLAGIVGCWLNPATGETFVVNGHNRIALAQNLGVNRVVIRLLTGCDSAIDARAKGALINISEGHGTAIDCGKFLRDSGFSADDLATKGIPLKSKVVQDGIALSNLAPSLFDRVVQSELDLGLAIILGSRTNDHTLQFEFLKLLDREKRQLSNAVLSELLDLVLASQGDQEFIPDLFGGEFLAKTYAVETAILQSHIKAVLGREKRLFSSVSRNADTLERGETRIDRDTSIAVKERSETLLERFTLELGFTGPVASTLRVYAEKLANGCKTAKKDCLDAITALLA